MRPPLDTLRRHPRAALRAGGAGLALLLLLVNLAHGPAAASSPPADPASLDAWVGAQLRDANIPGAAMAVVTGGRVDRVSVFGSADDAGRPVTPDTPFAIGSLSKSMTAVAVMQLVEGGRVELDAPIVRYLPSFRLADPQASAAITVRELLQHTAGIPTVAGRDALRRPVTTLEGQVAAMAAVQPFAPPGTAYAYSNLDYAVLGRLVEVVSGEPFGRYLSEHVTAPLGMTHTFTDLAAAQDAGLATAHRLWFGVPVGEAAAYRADLVPAGYVLSSARDMGRYLAALLDDGALDGARVLSAASVATMTTGAVPLGLGDGRYGLGWISGTVDGLPIVWHDGSTGDMASIAVMVPGRHLGVVILANAQSVVYELLSKLDLIGYGAAELLAGRAPGGTIAMLYPAVDVALAVLVLLQVRALWKVVRVPAPGRSAGRRRVPAWLWPLLTCAIWPAFVLWELPAALGAPWTVLAATDLGLAILLVVGLRLAIGGVRTWRWAVAGRGARTSIRLVPVVE